MPVQIKNFHADPSATIIRQHSETAERAVNKLMYLRGAACRLDI